MSDATRQPPKAGGDERLRRFARGLTHELNNLLAVIQGEAELAELHTPAGSPARRSLNQIRASCKRAGELSRTLQLYTGRLHIPTAPVELSQLVTRCQPSLAEPQLTTFLSFELAAGLPLTALDAPLVETALANLVANACEAAGPTGRVVVRTGFEQLGDADLPAVRAVRPLAAGRYVFVDVADDGPGMDADVLATATEPFFSTRRRAGLGLTQALGTAACHGGGLLIESTPGGGTRARLLFPIG
jgi:signal transduction histidine kinase